MVPIKWIEDLFAACQTGNYDTVDGVVEKMSRNGLPAAKVLDQFFHFSLDNDFLTDGQKAKVFQKISVRAPDNNLLFILHLSNDIMTDPGNLFYLAPSHIYPGMQLSPHGWW